MKGVVITEGLSDWQIIQQIDGYGKISMKGYAILPDENMNFKIMTRVLNESNGTVAVDWQECKVTSELEKIAETGEPRLFWEIDDLSIPAGGTYRVETGLLYNGSKREWASRGQFRYNVGVGDLYIIAGQSNSAGYGREPIFDPPEIGVHLFKNDEEWHLAAHPMNDFTKAKHITNLENSNPGHSPYLSFAKYLKRELGYPIGLIQTALGGSGIGSWLPNGKINLYSNMVDIVTKAGGKVRGMLWYQGCSDTGAAQAEKYEANFINLINATRNEIHDSKMPVLTVQLNRHTTNPTGFNPSWTKIRDIQRRIAQKYDNIYIVPTLDFNLNDEIHTSSSSNIVLGERLARAALGGIYKKQLPVSVKAPDIRTAKKTDDYKIVLYFDNAKRIDVFPLRYINDMFKIKDSSGDVNILKIYGSMNNTVTLEIDRVISGTASIDFAPSFYPQGSVPYDGESWLPLLGFCDIEIE